MELIFDEEECVVEEVIDDGKLLSCGDEKTQELLRHPDEIGRMVGFKDLTADLHGEWIKEMVYGIRDFTLQAHRGSFKSSCMAVAISLLLVIHSKKNFIFLRKTDNDVSEMLGIADDLQNAVVTLLAENPDKLPQTDDSTAQFINRFSSILMGYTDRGVLASGLWRGTPSGPLQTGDTVENGFALWADSYDDQPDADRAAHKAVPVQVGLVLAGSIESIVITVNVMV